MTAPESFNEVGRWFNSLEGKIKEGFDRLEARLDEAVQRRELEALEKRVDRMEARQATAESARSANAKWAIGLAVTLLGTVIALVAVLV